MQHFSFHYGRKAQVHKRTHTQHLSEKRLNSRHQLQEKHDQWPQGLRAKGDRQPRQELLSFDARIPEAAAFHAHYPM